MTNIKIKALQTLNRSYQLEIEFLKNENRKLHALLKQYEHDMYRKGERPIQHTKLIVEKSSYPQAKII